MGPDPAFDRMQNLLNQVGKQKEGPPTQDIRDTTGAA